MQRTDALTTVWPNQDGVVNALSFELDQKTDTLTQARLDVSVLDQGLASIRRDSIAFL